MMLSRIESGDGEMDGNPNNAQLLRDIEAISKALYLHKTPQRALVSPSGVRSKSVERPRLTESKSRIDPGILHDSACSEDKKSSSGWSWKKPLKVLSHIRRQKFNISFFLHVHSIEGLPPKFHGINLSVHWKRKDEILKTRPSRVTNGNAEFGETLMHKCCVYGSRIGPLHSAKYEAKLFLIYASVIGAPGIDMGKQWVDLTRLLPLTLEELEGETSAGKWTTSFKLSGKAKGAALTVSFGFSPVRNNSTESRSNLNISQFVDTSHLLDLRTDFGPNNSSGVLQRFGSIPNNLINSFPRFSQPADVKICDVIPQNPGIELSKSVNCLYEKLNEVNLHNSVELDMMSQEVQPCKPKPDLWAEATKEGSEKYVHTDFTVIEQGIEIPNEKELALEKLTVYNTHGSPIEIIDVDEIIEDDGTMLDFATKFHSEDIICNSCKDRIKVDDCKHEETSVRKNESLVEDLAESLSILEYVKCESQQAKSEFLGRENYVGTKTNYKASKAAKRSVSFDQSAESVASDFLNMLGIVHSPFGLSSESDPESPRERLLREFEKEALASGDFIISSDAPREHEVFGCIDLAETTCGDLSKGFDLSSTILASEAEHDRTSQLLSRRRNAKVLEDLETEDLMRRWGLNEQIFQSSSYHFSDGFGSPIELLPEEVLELPPLGDGYGPFVLIKDGSCLRSMNPSLFRNSKNVGSLIMQVSRPVVLPAEMGSDIMGILQHLASLGVENLYMQTSKLMPLEDLTGKTLQQIALDGRPGATRPNSFHRQATMFHQPLSGQDAFSRRKEAGRFGSHWFFSYNGCSLNIDEVTSDYATVEDLTPLAVDKIECMSIEGLKIQSGMSEEETMLNIKAESTRKISANLGEFHNIEGGAKLQLLEATGDGNEFDGLLGLSIPLEEWLRLDAGDIGDDDHVCEHTRMILAAHNAKCIDFVNQAVREDIDWEKAYGREHGLLGNNLTLALRILLRDPLRNYEPVGDSMLALIQVERSIFHPNLGVDRAVLETSSGEVDREWMLNGDSGDNGKEVKNRRCSLWFKITEVHLSGLHTKPGKNQLWGTKTHQQSGVRWLLASGMAKSHKHPISKSKAIVVSKPQFMTNAQNGDLLWSISSHVNSTEANWTHVRNPNVIFPE